MKRASVWVSFLLSFSMSLVGQTAATIQEFGGLTGNPTAIAAGPDGALWFVEDNGKIGRITTAGAVTELPAPTYLAGIATGPDGALWFTEFSASKIGRLTISGAITEFPTPTAHSGPQGITAGPDGALWFVEDNGKIGRITTLGVITEFPIPTPDSLAGGITAGPDGAVWFTEYIPGPSLGKIGRITTSGVITEFPVPTSLLVQVSGISAGPDGALWFTEFSASKIGRLTISGAITEFPTPTAHSGPQGITAGPDGALWFTEDVGKIGRITTSGAITEFPTPSANSPQGITAGPDGAMWFTEGIAGGIGKIGRVVVTSPPPNTNNYTITTVAGNGTVGHSGDGGPATSAAIVVDGVAVDQLGNLYVTDGYSIRRVDASSHVITSVAGSVAAPFSNVKGVAVDNSGNFYIAETGGHNIYEVSGGIVKTLTNKPSSPAGLTVDGAGNLYIADSDHCQILKLIPGSTNPSAVAGSTCGYSGDNGPALSAQLLYPQGVAVDTAGNIFIADTTNSRVRKVSPSGTITTVAGTGVNGFSGDGGPGTAAMVNGPTDVAVDSAGNLYIAEFGNSKIRKVDTSGTINTIAGGGPSLADGVPATSAQLSFPYGLAVDAAGDVFIGDSGDYRIRKLTPVPPPLITSLNPSSAAAGAPAFTLTVNGTGFANGAAVLFDNVSTTTTYVSATQLAAAIPASMIATAHTATVQVSNPQGGVSNSVNFPVTGGSGSGLTIITASPLPAGVVGSPYSQALDATGGATPYKSWAVISGSLPPGISLTTVGSILTGLLGTPTASGTFTFTVQVTDNTNATATKAFSLTVTGGGGGPSISANGIVNSASYAGGSVVPGEIVAIYGTGLGPNNLVSLQLDNRGYVSNSLGGTRVLFDGVPAPMIYTSATQVSAVVPYEVSGSTQVHVVYQGQSSNIVTMPVAATLPGIFTADSSGHGQGAIVNQDGTINSSTNPAAAGSIVFVYGTGEGQTNPAGVDAKPDGSPAPTPVAQPGMTATIGGVDAQVLYAGGVPGLVAGVLQVNVQIPTTILSGSLPIQLSIGGQGTSAGVTVAVKFSGAI